MKENDTLQIPCKDCVCLAVCKHKPVRYMFEQCLLIRTFFEEYVDRSTNRSIVVDIIAGAHMMNDIHSRYFIPIYTKDTYDIGFVDVDPNYYERTNNKQIVNTHRIFKEAYSIDLLDIPKTREYLLAIIEGSED